MNTDLSPIGSGIDGLDDILSGGFVPGRMYLVHGQPGSGKTMLGIHFLEEGLKQGETALFVHGEESREEILANGAALNVDISDAFFLDLGPDSAFFTEDYSYDLVEPSEIEQDRYTQDIYEAIREIDPDRVVIDPITQLRYVEADEYQFRKRILSFMRFLKERNVTVLTTATPSSDVYNTEIQSLSDGIVALRRAENGQRRIDVTKHRALGQKEGDNGMKIRENGIEVYPRLDPHMGERPFETELLTFGIDQLDDLTGGGFDRGSVTFISGPTGAGKTSTGTHLLAKAAGKGLRSVVYLFEEDFQTYTHRSESIGLPISELQSNDLLSAVEIKPRTYSSEEFAHMVVDDIEENGTDIVMIDGIDGYTTAIQGAESDLIRKYHALTRYLKQYGVTTITTNEIPEITGITSAADNNLSYVADNIMFLSYVEMDGSLRKVVGMLKKRSGAFEHNLREFTITADGIEVGDSLTGLYGILQGTPRDNGRMGSSE
ncbi:ATPase domain-containing protein [Natrialbaceae archaeon A-CW1-1]